ncbi:MAG: tRNA (adenosine(37)-N6)-threonylcarbamoyltransferase complex ATPase subunit type 1 TsaE [Patescibacteria group bacterium]
MILTSYSAEETFAIGQKIGESCEGGEVFLLSGDLGAGKTCLTQGIAAGLGIKGRVNSPTFNIMKVYKIKKGLVKTLCHIDAYRLKTGQDLINIGFDDYLQKDSVIVIEWAELVESIWPKDRIKIEIKNFKDGRKIKISR